MFSKERFQLEEKNNRNVHINIQEELDRYATKCKQTNSYIIGINIYQIIRWKRVEEYVTPNIQFNIKSVIDLALMYSKKCIILWSIIRLQTKMGKNNPNLFNFNDFIFSAMKLFETGLVINLGIKNESIIIIEKDVFLASFPFSNITNIKKKKFKTTKVNFNIFNQYDKNDDKGIIPIFSFY